MRKLSFFLGKLEKRFETHCVVWNNGIKPSNKHHVNSENHQTISNKLFCTGLYEYTEKKILWKFYFLISRGWGNVSTAPSPRILNKIALDSSNKILRVVKFVKFERDGGEGKYVTNLI